MERGLGTGQRDRKAPFLHAVFVNKVSLYSIDYFLKLNLICITFTHDTSTVELNKIRNSFETAFFK
jgi:hypothetical protein